MTDQDVDPPWKRAGGYPKEDWDKCLRLASKRAREARLEYEAFMNARTGVGPEWLKERERLRRRLDEAEEARRGVLRGDSKAVSDLFGEVLMQEDQRGSP